MRVLRFFFLVLLLAAGREMGKADQGFGIKPE